MKSRDIAMTPAQRKEESIAYLIDRIKPPDVYCRVCGSLMNKAKPVIVDDGYSEDSGKLKWEWRQRYICPVDGTKTDRVTNYFNTSTWYKAVEMSQVGDDYGTIYFECHSYYNHLKRWLRGNTCLITVYWKVRTFLEKSGFCSDTFILPLLQMHAGEQSQFFCLSPSSFSDLLSPSLRFISLMQRWLPC